MLFGWKTMCLSGKGSMLMRSSHINEISDVSISFLNDHLEETLGLQSKGKDYFRSWFPFFSCFTWWQFCICLDVVWSKDFSAHFFFFRCLIGNFLSFCFLPLFWLRIFSFCFLPILLIGNFLLFSSFPLFFCFCFLLRARFMVSWDFGSRFVERLDMIYVRVWPTVRG